MAVVVATGVTDDGHREVLGVDTVSAEDEGSWTAFLRSLVARDLRGVQLVLSDAHEGLKNAIGKVLHGACVSAARSGVAPGRRYAAGRERFACDRLLRLGRATGRGGDLGGAQAGGGGTVMVPTSGASSAGSRSARVRAQSRGQSSR